MSFDNPLIVALVPGVVEVSKRCGLPIRYAGAAAIVIAIALVALTDLGESSHELAAPAGWILAGVVYGLAASGLYSQWRQLPQSTPNE